MKPTIILLGPQGSGKGTQAARLVERHGYIVIGAGQLLRDHVADGDTIGQEIKEQLRNGTFVREDIIRDLVEQTLGSLAIHQPVIFDGFPRTLAQAGLVDQLLTRFDRPGPQVVYLTLSKAEVFRRLGHRHICGECGKVLEPDQAALNLCPKCGGQISTRIDDQPEAIEARLALFERETLPLVTFYEGRHQLVRVDGSQEVDQVSRDIEIGLHLVVG